MSKSMKYCDGRGTSYRNGNSYEDCKKIAEEINSRLKPSITTDTPLPWKQLSDEVEQIFHDKSMTSFSAWNRLFDQTISNMKVDIDGESKSLEEALNYLLLFQHY